MGESQSFEEVVTPLIKWLNKDANPHAVILIDVDGAVLYSGGRLVVIVKFSKSGRNSRPA